MQRISQSATASPLPTLEPSAPTAPEVVTPRPGSRDAAGGAGGLDVPARSSPGTPQRLAIRSRGNSFSGRGPPMSRTNSTNTITQSRLLPGSPGKLGAQSSRGPIASSPRQKHFAAREVTSKVAESSSSSSDGSSEAESSDGPGGHHLGKSQKLRRAPRFSATKAGKARLHAGVGDAADDGGAEDDDDEPAFFTFGEPQPEGQQDLGATLTTPQAGQPSARPPIGVTKIASASNTDSSASSIASSAVPVASPRGLGIGQNPPGALSPRQKAQLAGVAASPRRRAAGGKDGSDGAPSMGSSFSDLDGAS